MKNGSSVIYFLDDATNSGREWSNRIVRQIVILRRIDAVLRYFPIKIGFKNIQNLFPYFFLPLEDLSSPLKT